MDVSKITSTSSGGDDARRASGVQSRQAAPASGSKGSTSGSSGSSAVNATSDSTREDAPATSTPVAGGLVGAPGVESGTTRDAADARQSQDRAPDAAELGNQIRRRFEALAAEARLPTNTRLSIDFDGETPRFRVVNKESGDVIREIPERDFIELIRKAGGGEGLIDGLF